MKSRTEALPPPMIDLLLQALAPAEIEPAQAARIKQRLLERVAAAAPAEPFIDIRAAEGWRPMGEGAQMKILHDDGRTLSWLVRLAPGGRVGAHTHAEGPEECLVLSGDAVLNGKHYSVGDYQLAAAGSTHDDVYSETGCVLYVRSPSPRAARRTA